MTQNNEDLFFPRMPEVYDHDDIEAVFARARAAAGEPKLGDDGVYRRQIIIVTPGRLLIGKDCPLPAQLNPEQIALLEKFVPRQPVLQIGVITYTLLEALKKDIRQAIPFVDYLLGFSTLGHSVWIFEGHPAALAAGCRSADLLLIDSAMLPELEKFPDWRETALKAMRGKEIKLISRT